MSIADSKNSYITPQIITVIGRTLVIAGALWKSACEIGEMCNSNFWHHVNSTVSDY